METNYRYVFSEFLRGNGIEIGALNNPFRVPDKARVRYVDKFTAEEMSKTYPDVPTHQIRVPDIVCKTGELNAIEDNSLDFIIACHVLEHADDPLRMLYTWHRKLKTGALLLLVLPDSRFTFDRGRPLTSLEHLLWDFERRGTSLKELTDLSHIAECNLNMHDSLDVDSALELAKTILRTSRDTHFHVWTYDSFRRQLDTLISEFGLPYRIKRSACDEKFEMLFLLNAVATSGDPIAFDALGVSQRSREGFREPIRIFSRLLHKITSLLNPSGRS
jgi:SAM-dependent methyltransferase